MAFQAHNFTLDDTYKLTAAVSFTAATGVEVAGTVSSIDLGQVAPAFNVNTSSYAPYGRFAVVLDWGTIDTTITGSYLVMIEGAEDSTFSTGKTRLATLTLGSAGQCGYEFDTPSNAREVFYLDNVSLGTTSTSSGTAYETKRFIRIRFVAFYSAGSANLQVQNAWLVPIQ